MSLRMHTGRCTSGESTRDKCGRPLYLRVYTSRDGKQDAATVCLRCDATRVWAEYEQTTKAA